MASLSSIAAKRLERINKRPHLPEWWEIFGGLLVFVLVVTVAIGLMRGHGSPTALGTPLPAPRTSVARPVSPPVVSSPGTTPARAPVSSAPTGSEAVPSAKGNTKIVVPRAAVAAARAAALAQYTGNYTKVPLAPGAHPKLPFATFPYARIERVEVVSASTSAALFDFIVAPDRTGGLRLLPVQVVRDAGRWVYPVPTSSGASG